MLSSWSHFMIQMKNYIAHLCLLRKLLSEWVKQHQFYTHYQHRWAPLCLKLYYPSYSLKQNSFLPLQNFFILLLNCSVSSVTCYHSFSSTQMTQLLPFFPPLAVDKPIFNLLSTKHANIFCCLLLPNKCLALLTITKCISFYWVWSFAFILPPRYFLEHLYKPFGVWKICLPEKGLRSSCSLAYTRENRVTQSQSWATYFGTGLPESEVLLFQLPPKSPSHPQTTNHKLSQPLPNTCKSVSLNLNSENRAQICNCCN